MLNPKQNLLILTKGFNAQLWPFIQQTVIIQKRQHIHVHQQTVSCRTLIALTLFPRETTGNIPRGGRDVSSQICTENKILVSQGGKDFKFNILFSELIL
jgi:hypothetical protein